MVNYNCLYYFQHPEIDLLEIQRTDLPKDLGPEAIYHWLVLAKVSGRVWKLDFKSMTKGEGWEERSFREGGLNFNQTSATLSILGKEYKLTKLMSDNIPQTSQNSVEEYLNFNRPGSGIHSFRELKPADIAYFKEWIFDSEVIRYSMTKFHLIKTHNEIEAWFDQTLKDDKVFQLAIIDDQTKEFIGYAGIAGLNPIDRNGEYFIFLGNKNFWGKGIASKVTKKIVEIGFLELGLERVFLTASSKNLAGLKAYQKAGFVNEGIMRKAFFRNNEFSDKLIMGILREEFLKDYRR